MTITRHSTNTNTNTNTATATEAGSNYIDSEW